MTEVCIVEAHVLRGLLKVAPKDDVRYYLNGIYFDTQNSTLVATNGKSMLMVKHELPKTVKPFILARAIIESALKLASKKAPAIAVSIQHENGALWGSVTLNAVKGIAVGQEIDGKYPDYRRVVPTKFSGEPAQFEPSLIATLHEAIRLIRDKDVSPIHIVMNGAGASLVTSADPLLVGVAMSWITKGDEAWTAPALNTFSLQAAA